MSAEIQAVLVLGSVLAFLGSVRLYVAFADHLLRRRVAQRGYTAYLAE